MVTISGKTRLLGIFGDPVAHSLSPAMQNAALVAAGIDAVYLPFHIRPEQLESAVEAIRSLDLVGINVTVPYKVKIIPFLDAIDKEAAVIGAVNTVVNCKGFLTGCNTDAPGFVSSLRYDLQVDPQGKQVVVIGAGGACRAALTALAGHGVEKVMIANRTREKAEILAQEMLQHFPATAFTASSLDESDLGESLSRADLLVNATSIGLSGEVFPDFMVARLNDCAAVYDMVYAQEATPLVKAVRQRGLNCADGRGMLVAQGEAAFFRWFGVMPPSGLMASRVIEKQSIF